MPVFQRFPLNTKLKDHSPAVTRAPLPFATGLCQALPVEGAGGTLEDPFWSLRSTLPVGSLLLPQSRATFLAHHPHWQNYSDFNGKASSIHGLSPLQGGWLPRESHPHTDAGQTLQPMDHGGFLIPSFHGCAGSAFRVVAAPRPALPLVANNTLL